MSASQYNFGASSQTDDLLLGIIQRLGTQIESSTGINPDAQFDYRFAASDYNYGNRSQTDDLLEEILNRINQLGGGGGGGADGNDRTKVSANDTTAGFLQDKFNLNQSEVMFSVTNEGANENMKLLAQFATRIGERAMIGTTEGTAKLTVQGNTGEPILRVLRPDGSETFRIDENGDKVFRGQSFDTGNLKFPDGGILVAGNEIVNVARIRLQPNLVQLESQLGRVQLTDRLFMSDGAQFRSNNNLVLFAFDPLSWGITNGVRCGTGMSFARNSGAEAHIAFRNWGRINMNAEGIAGTGNLEIQQNGANRFTFHHSGNFIYHAPAATGYADAAAVQADTSLAVGTIATLSNGTLVRKQ